MLCGVTRPSPGAILTDDGEPTIKDPPTSTEPKVPRGDTGLEAEELLPPDDTNTNDTKVPKDLIREPGKIEIPNLK